MDCATCQHDNPEYASFCEGCGWPLPWRCGACEGDNRANARFCSHCGIPRSPAQSGRSRSALHSQLVGAAGTDAPERSDQRYGLTPSVLFCKLDGLAGLSHQFEPGLFREIVSSYKQACLEVIARFGGAVIEYERDALLVSFPGSEGSGYEHDERASRAADALSNVLNALAHSGLPTLDVHVRVETGFFVLGKARAMYQLAEAATPARPAEPGPASTNGRAAENNEQTPTSAGRGTALAEGTWGIPDPYLRRNRAGVEQPSGELRPVAPALSSVPTTPRGRSPAPVLITVDPAHEADDDIAPGVTHSPFGRMLRALIPGAKQGRNGALGGRVASAREARGWSQADVADSLGVSVRTIEKIEAGQLRPHRDQLEELADILAVPYEHLASLAGYSPRRPADHLNGQ